MSCVVSHQRLKEYQRRLDFSSLKQSENPVILELKVRKENIHDALSVKKGFLSVIMLLVHFSN